MERERLIELNKKYGDNLVFQQMLQNYLKIKFEPEVIKLREKRRLQNV